VVGKQDRGWSDDSRSVRRGQPVGAVSKSKWSAGARMVRQFAVSEAS
jgi:hypothetical protein